MLCVHTFTNYKHSDCLMSVMYVIYSDSVIMGLIFLKDHLSKLLQLQSQLGNYEIIKPGRIFLKDGELFKLSRKGMQPRYFILVGVHLIIVYMSVICV
jgi:hypothetical protein